MQEDRKSEIIRLLSTRGYMTVEELVRNADAHNLEPDLERVAEAEDEAGDEDADAGPSSENDGCEGDPEVVSSNL